MKSPAKILSAPALLASIFLAPALLAFTFFEADQTPSPDAAASAPAGDAVRGKVVYERYCVSCHGESGDGKGETAEWISPKPRDFRQGVFKWRSTPSGSLPTVSDLERTIENGLYGTRMPSWYPIGHRNRLDVIAYIQDFSPRWKEEQAEPPIVIPPEPPDSEESVGRGRAVYVKLDCTKCHGANGRGDGPSARGLFDDWMYPIVPHDLTHGHFKGGDAGSDIYRTVMTGLSGTPMPSFVDSVSTAEAWDLVHYVQSLSRESGRSDKGAMQGR
jgi:cytochrome c oxidase cbb3-type subunit 2